MQSFIATSTSQIGSIKCGTNSKEFISSVCLSNIILIIPFLADGSTTTTTTTTTEQKYFRFTAAWFSPPLTLLLENPRAQKYIRAYTMLLV